MMFERFSQIARGAVHRLGLFLLGLASIFRVKMVVLVCETPEDDSAPVKAFCDVVGSKRLRIGFGKSRKSALIDLANRDLLAPSEVISAEDVQRRMKGTKPLALALLCLLPLAGCLPTPNPAPKPTGGAKGVQVAPEQLQAEILAATNQLRARYGRAPLVEDSKLEASALEQAQFIASIGQLTHLGPNGSNVGQRITAEGEPWAAAAENAAEYPGAPTGGDIVRMWEGDRWHLRDMLGPYTHTGSHCSVDSLGRAWIVADYARPAE